MKNIDRVHQAMIEATKKHQKDDGVKKPYEQPNDSKKSIPNS